MSRPAHHQLQVIGWWPVLAVRLTHGDEGKTLVLVALPIHCLIVETGSSSLGFLGGDQGVDLVLRDFENTAPDGVPGLAHEGWEGTVVGGVDEHQLRFRVVGREHEPCTRRNLSDEIGVEERRVGEIEGWSGHGRRMIPTVSDFQCIPALPEFDIVSFSVSVVRRSVLLLAFLAACGGPAVSSSTTSEEGQIEAETDTTTTSERPTTEFTDATTTTSLQCPVLESDRPAAPDFTLELGDGGKYTLSDGCQPVYLVFWAEW